MGNDQRILVGAPRVAPKPALPSRWREGAAIYHVYLRSFADGNGDFAGDLAGLRAHLDHLSWLGVDALWLSPSLPSPDTDWGYTRPLQGRRAARRPGRAADRAGTAARRP